jgi:hypothetical protein
VLVSSYGNRDGEPVDSINLRGNEGAIVER